MANEDLIYRITRAVYDRLGGAVDDTTVEQLVTDIYNQVQSSGNNVAASRAMERTPAAEGSSDRAMTQTATPTATRHLPSAMRRS